MLISRSALASGSVLVANGGRPSNDLTPLSDRIGKSRRNSIYIPKATMVAGPSSGQELARAANN
jgi:hypothetical protein